MIQTSTTMMTLRVKFNEINILTEAYQYIYENVIDISNVLLTGCS